SWALLGERVDVRPRSRRRLEKRSGSDEMEHFIPDVLQGVIHLVVVVQRIDRVVAILPQSGDLPDYGSKGERRLLVLADQLGGAALDDDTNMPSLLRNRLVRSLGKLLND